MSHRKRSAISLVKEQLDDCRKLYEGLAGKVTKRARDQACIHADVRDAAFAVQSARDAVQAAYKEAVEKGAHAESLLLFKEIEPLQKTADWLKQLAHLIDPEAK